jgi:hypothetical protein
MMGEDQRDAKSQLQSLIISRLLNEMYRCQGVCLALAFQELFMAILEF